MRAMRTCLAICLLLLTAVAPAADKPVTEDAFRRTLKVGPEVKMVYRDLECRVLRFDEFVAAMREPGLGSEVTRAPDGSAVALTLHRRGGPNCPSPFGRVIQMPDFDMPDLKGKRVTSASLRGKPTLINFYFAKCVPCILEVGPLNGFAVERRDLNVLAVTFDEVPEAQAFVNRYGFAWRVVPDARDFIDRMAVKRYPMMALFDAQGRLLGTRAGGAKDELEAAAVAPTLRRWVDGLLRASAMAPKPSP
jgi:thiol-disulfide isomerase/thioredoxin